MNVKMEFVDTNILIYAYDTSEPLKRKIAMSLLKRLWENKCGCLSIQVMHEFYVTLTKKMTNLISPDQAISIVCDLGMWKHHVPGLPDILESVRIQKQYGLSFWDAAIINSAVKMNCEILWTEDLNHGQVYAGLTVLNPFLSGSGPF